MNPQDSPRDTLNTSMPAVTTAGAMPAAANPSMTGKGQGEHDITKAYVLQARQIISQTVHDPYAQASQLAALKAQYLLNEHGKQIKTET